MVENNPLDLFEKISYDNIYRNIGGNLDKKDNSIEEVLKRLKSIDYRLNSIEKFLKREKEEEESIEEFLKGEKEEKIAKEQPTHAEKEEVAYLIKENTEEIKEEKKAFVYEKPVGAAKVKDTAVTSAQQEKRLINILHIIGVFALAIGVGLFIKYTLPIIGPWLRIFIGLIIGIGLLYLGEILIKKYKNYALGISSCGIVILYFSCYAGSAFYDLFPPAIAFLLMLLVTVTGVLLSLRYDSSIVSFIAVIGAFLTPYVFRGGEITPLALTILFLYLSLINGWILTVTKIKEWKWLNILAFSLTAMMLLTTIRFASESGYPWVFLTFSTVFFLLFFYLSERTDPESLVLFFLNPFLYYFVCWFVTYKINPYISGTWALALSAFYYYQGTLSEKKNSLERALSFTSLAVFFLTIAIPVFLKAKWSTFAWALEGTVILSLRRKEKVLKVLPLILIGIAVFKMLFMDYLSPGVFPFFFNSLIVIICVFLCARFLSGGTDNENKNLVSALSILGMFLVFWFTIAGTEKFFNKFSHFEETRTLVISMLWGIYALVLFMVGIAKENPPARSAGFVMASLTIIKVFFHDLSYLETIYRVLSFVVLGVILLLISFIYQKKMGRKDDDE